MDWTVLIGCRNAHQSGLTLVELMSVIAVVATLGFVAVPSFSDHLARHRLKNAVEDIHGLVLKARLEGVIRDQNLSVTIQPDGQSWCMGVAATPACDCDRDGDCLLPVARVDVHNALHGDDYPGVFIGSNFSGAGRGPTFHRIRGTAPGGTITVVSGAWRAELRVTPHGRLRVCAPSSSGHRGRPALLGYPAC